MAYRVFNVGARPHLFKGTAGTHDLQMVEIGLGVLVHPVALRLQQLNRMLGEKYNEVLFPSIVQDTLHGVAAQYNASQLVTQRETVSRDICKLLISKATESFHIAIDDVSITNITFGEESTAAIEAKIIAAQEAERAKDIVEKAEQDNKSGIIKGEATECSFVEIRLRILISSKEILVMISTNTTSTTDQS